MALLVTLGLIFAVAYVLLQVYKKYLTTGYNDDLPVVVGIPLVDRPPVSRIEDVHVFELETTKRLAPVYRSIALHKPWLRTITVGDPNVLREIYVGPNWEKFDRLHYTSESMDAHAGGLILMKNGQHWREAREHLGTKTFSSTTMRTYVPILREQFGFLLGQIEKKRTENGDNKLDLQELYNNMTFDMISRLVFGESVSAQTTKEGAQYLTAWESVLEKANILSLLHSLAGKYIWPLLPSLYNTYLKDLGMIYSLINRNVDRRKRGEDLDRVSILDDFMRNEKVNDWLKTDEEIRKQMITLLFAGHDTTAALLSFVTYMLAIHPVWQQRLREEIFSAFGKPVDASDLVTDLGKLENLPVLNGVIKETLRIYPSAPFGGGRVMNCDFLFKYTDVNGAEKQIDFRNGDAVFPSMYIAQMTQEFWDPKYGPVEEWNPERFIADPNGGAKSMYAYAPFGNGARRCAGERLALGEARLTISELVRRYEWRMQDDFKFSVLMTGTIKAKDGVKVVMTPLKA